MVIKRLAIANRGEVAVRIIRACQEMGIESVLLHSEADIKTRAYRLADHKVCIGPAPVSESYLSIPKNINGALAKGADGIHPGFGFLSENADFARACEESNLIFVGPRAEVIENLGDKISSKKIVTKTGVPTVPGYQGEDQSLPILIEEAEKIGFPVIVKAAAGGGGRGMKIISTKEQAQEQIESAQREATAAFGSPKVFLEKYLDKAKHIEFQIFGDASGKVVHFFDRECSVQRRHQKVIEEATSPSLTPELREKMGEAAVAIATQAGYTNAGTVEFLLQDEKFYFLEVNTRLQVEHPVTEMVLGVDLVKAQIRTAQGEPVFAFDRDLSPQGHSIECRLYAEDSYNQGVPSIGLLGAVKWPDGPGRRFEYGFERGDEITPYYDSMIAKIIVWDESRRGAIAKMLRVLDDVVIFGVKTNIPYLKEILNHSEFRAGTMTTQFIAKHFPRGLEKKENLSMVEQEFSRRVLEQMSQSSSPKGVDPTGMRINTQPSPWFHKWRSF